MTDRDPALDPFDALIGTWTTEATHPMHDGVVPDVMTFAKAIGGLDGITKEAPAFAATLRAYRSALASNDTAMADGLLAWLAGQPNVSERQGYNIRHWVQGDLTYWLISDVEADQLAALEALLRKGE